MVRVLTLAALVAALTAAASGQEPGVLHIKVTLTDAARGSIPVPRHALLISDNPTTSSPRRVVTGPDGTADVRLRAGNYTVESDEPLTFDGKTYQWTKMLDIAVGRDAVLELNAANAEIGVATAPSATAPSSSPEAKATDLWLLVPQWKDSVVAVWTSESRASGFIVDAAGLVLTSQRAVGGASAVEVQITSSIKVSARVLAADPTRDVAVLWIDPAATASIRPVPLDCAAGARPPLSDGQKVVTIGVPLRGPRDVTPGEVIRVDSHAAIADFRLARGTAGGPVFGAAGEVVGISSVVEDEDERSRRDARIVAVADACEVVRSAEKARQKTERPIAARLPVEPLHPTPAEALAAAVRGRGGSLNPYQLSSSDFDVSILTPVVVYAAQRNAQQSNARGGPGAHVGPGQQIVPTDFGDWSEYFADVPPVLVVRVTPKLAESFWTTLGRGAASTQGVALPPMKHFKSGFSRLRLFCGDAEVTPIHPFTLAQRVSETDAIREGLYVFEPDALGPKCVSVKVALYSDKAPDKPDTRAVDPHVIDRIWQDFAPYRAVAGPDTGGLP